MKALIVLIAGIVVGTNSFTAIADESLSATYRTLVDDSGNIAMPDDFRTDWTFLGTWAIAEENVERSSDASGPGAAALHNVYTQPGVVAYFRSNGSFPDGAVLIKELLKADTARMTTGTVSRGTTVDGWFVMIKDTEARFSGNPLWGDGWGWALFNADQPNKSVTANYKTECIGCHIPARDDDWVYLSGYPVLAD